MTWRNASMTSKSETSSVSSPSARGISVSGRGQRPPRSVSIAWSVSADRLNLSYSSRRWARSARGSSSGSPGRAGQEHLRLDVDELGGQRDVLGGDVEVELPHRVEVGRVLLRDLGDRDVGDRDLVDADQVQQQVERAGEGRDRDGRKDAVGSLVGASRLRRQPHGGAHPLHRLLGHGASARRRRRAGRRGRRPTDAREQLRPPLRGTARARRSGCRSGASCSRRSRAPPSGTPRPRP